MLTLVYTLNYLDQDLITLLLQPIQEDLHISDTQLGFLTGMAFALFYATVGLPMARWADRGNRVTITSVAIALWGGTVMLSLIVTNYTQLVFARIAAAIGESGCMPPTYSLVGDYFPQPAERTRAMTVYMLASPLAALISFIAGGWLNQIYGWRVAFFVMGTPAILVAAIVKLTVSEPRMIANRAIPDSQFPGLFELLRTLWCQRSTRHLILGFVLLYALGAGLSPWYAAFMMRSHGMRTAELGLWLGLIFGISGVGGIAFGGYATARWFADNERGQMRLSAVAVALILPCSALFLLLQQKVHALVALLPLVLVFNFFFGPTFALLQRLVVAETRATTLAVVMLLANLIGMGVGPQIVGVLSDWLMPGLGRESLRYAMLITSSLALWAAAHFWMVGRTVQRDLAAMASSQSDVRVVSLISHVQSIPARQ